MQNLLDLVQSFKAQAESGKRDDALAIMDRLSQELVEQGFTLKEAMDFYSTHLRNYIK